MRFLLISWTPKYPLWQSTSHRRPRKNLAGMNMYHLSLRQSPRNNYNVCNNNLSFNILLQYFDSYNKQTLPLIIDLRLFGSNYTLVLV